MMETFANQSEDEVKAEVVDLRGGLVDTIEAEKVHVTRGGANRILASEVDMDVGGALVTHGEKIE